MWNLPVKRRYDLASLMNVLKKLRASSTQPPRLISTYHSKASPAMTAIMGPSLWKAMEDGSERAIEEEDLFKYQRYRWLNGESEKLAVRYRKFNLEALLDAAIKATGDKRRSCVKLLKCVEGQFNKAFILTMDNGEEVVARIPNPNAGPAFYTVASEVATRHFLRHFLGVPIPRIYAWSPEASNPVGAEYVIEEKANGRPLGNLWFQWSKESQFDVVRQIVDIEAKLESVSFSMHGSIYYRSDLVANGINCELLSSIIRKVDSQAIVGDSALLDDFAIGPSIDPKIWEGERARMDLDRGPWSSPNEYVTAIATNEVHWAKAYAQPRLNPHRSMEHHETPEDYISLLNRYLTLVPHLFPSSATRGGENNTISHPDLHLDNIFADPETRRITSIIDWQSASISPVFLQRKWPRMLEPLSQSSSRQTSPQLKERELEDISPLAYYEHLTRERNSLRWETLNEEYISVRTKPTSLVPGCWDKNDMFSFRNSLINVMAHWDDLVPPGTPCPIQFTREELEQHQDEMELLEGVSGIMHQLQDECMIPLGGMVRSEDYRRAKGLSDRFKQVFVDLAEDECQRELYRNVWPY